MRPVSQDFLDALTGSHKAVFEAYTLLEDEPNTGSVTHRNGVDPAGFGNYTTAPGRTTVQVPIADGFVELDGSADVRGSCELVVPGVDDDGNPLWPLFNDDRIAPYGQELFLRRGIEFAPGVVEWVSLGFFGIDEVDQRTVNGDIRITGFDRMKRIIDSRILYPIQFGPSTTLGGLFEHLIEEVYPAGFPTTPVWEFQDTSLLTEPIGRNIVVEESRYEPLVAAIAKFGQIMYWDHRGILVVKPMPNESEPSLSVHSGKGGTLIDARRRVSRDQFYNAVVAYGEGTDDIPPARYAVVDDNRTSPTYFYGRFGQVPRYYFSPFITNVAQAESAAASLLSKYSGLPYELEFEMSPNPALEPYDVVAVRYPGRTELHSIERLQVPLTNRRSIVIDTREKRQILEDE